MNCETNKKKCTKIYKSEREMIVIKEHLTGLRIIIFHYIMILQTIQMNYVSDFVPGTSNISIDTFDYIAQHVLRAPKSCFFTRAL